MRIYAYVVIPGHVHLLVSEPTTEPLADAMHFLKLSFTKRLRRPGSFWQKRYYDRNIRDAAEFDEKLGYIQSQSGKERLGENRCRLAMEQFSSLYPARNGSG